MPRAALAILVLSFGCNEYDLGRQPDDPGTKIEDTGTPVVETDAPDIRIYCKGDEACTALDFSFVMQDCPSDWKGVTLENVGGETLDVTEVLVEGDGGSYFETDFVATTIAPSEKTSFQVRFTPGAQVTYAPTLYAVSNDPDTPRAPLTLTGTGAEYSRYEETFNQPNVEHPVDILWVVDASGSMSEENDLVQDNFAVFIDNFVTLGLDYHIGVIAADMDSAIHQGKLVGDPTFATSDMSAAEVERTFNNAVADIYARGTSDDEKGMDAVKAALSEPLVSDYNAGFLRDTDAYGNEVAISVIIVSDENDYSSTSVSSFTRWFQGLKSDPALATFSAVCGDPASSAWSLGGCTNMANGTYAGEAGQDYIDAADATGGMWSSICSSDFTSVLEFLSITSAGLEVEFFLAKEPRTIATMDVQVNGADVSYYSAASGNGWLYDTDRNSVTFYGEAIPDPGATIFISYEYEGGC